MAFTVEYKKKSAAGFTHTRVVVDGQNAVTDLYNTATQGGVEGLEFFTVRVVRPKPEPKPKEVKK